MMTVVVTRPAILEQEYVETGVKIQTNYVLMELVIQEFAQNSLMSAMMAILVLKINVMTLRAVSSRIYPAMITIPALSINVLSIHQEQLATTSPVIV